MYCLHIPRLNGHVKEMGTLALCQQVLGPFIAASVVSELAPRWCVDCTNLKLLLLQRINEKDLIFRHKVSLMKLGRCLRYTFMFTAI